MKGSENHDAYGTPGPSRTIHQDGGHRTFRSLGYESRQGPWRDQARALALLNGRAALSPEMALRAEKAFGPKMDTLLRMQTAFEIAEVREREANIKVKRYVAKPPAAHDHVDQTTL